MMVNEEVFTAIWYSPIEKPSAAAAVAAVAIALRWYYLLLPQRYKGIRSTFCVVLLVLLFPSSSLSPPPSLVSCIYLCACVCMPFFCVLHFPLSSYIKVCCAGFHFSMFSVARISFFPIWFYLRIFRCNLRAHRLFIFRSAYLSVCECVCILRSLILVFALYVCVWVVLCSSIWIENIKWRARKRERDRDTGEQRTTRKCYLLIYRE